MTAHWIDAEYYGDVFDFHGRPAWSLTHSKTGRGRGGFSNSMAEAEEQLGLAHEVDRYRSFFIALEGAEGVGKSTLLESLIKAFDPLTLFATAEPNPLSVGYDFIRKYLKGENNCSSFTMALAYALNRADHVRNHVSPFLTTPRKLVITDRYVLSSLVYQGGEEVSSNEILELNREAPVPDLTLLLLANTDTLVERLRARNGEKEIFDDRIAYLGERYIDCADFLESRGYVFQTLDANQPATHVYREALFYISRHAPLWLPVP